MKLEERVAGARSIFQISLCGQLTVGVQKAQGLIRHIPIHHQFLRCLQRLHIQSLLHVVEICGRFRHHNSFIYPVPLLCLTLRALIYSTLTVSGYLTVLDELGLVEGEDGVGPLPTVC